MSIEIPLNISILYVEDIKAIREVVGNILKQKNQNIYLAQDGYEGLDIYKKFIPEIVITDIQMPGMDGISMTKEIKKINPDVQIIFCTAFIESKYFIEAIESGINFYLLKPVDNKKLFAAIDKCVDILKMRKQKQRFEEEILEIVKEKTTELTFTTQNLLKEIQQREMAEKALQKNNEELELRVKKRTSQLEMINRKLQNEIKERKKAEKQIFKVMEKEKELNLLKSQFISTVSHEFRTPLAGININAQLLQRYIEKPIDDNKIKCFNRIYDAIDHLTLLLDDVSLINKEQNGKLIYAPVKVNFENLCNNIIEEILINNDNTTIHKNFDYIYDEILIDVKLMRYILVNLLSNSIKYSTENPQIAFKSFKNQSNDKICISIQDNGIGIPEEDLQKIYEPFHRGTNVNNISGTGLGMSIVKRCIDICKGEIFIKSKVNHGTIVIISIPYSRV
ncbi:MAG: response regulator [Bacteroidota bacterium]|nr:response regulator [Bacteroidota bacterium]